MTEPTSPSTHPTLFRVMRIAAIVAVLFCLWAAATFMMQRRAEAPVLQTIDVPVPSVDTGDRVDALYQKIESLAARVKTLEMEAAAPKPVPVISADGNPVRMNELATQIAAQGDALAEMKIATEKNNRRLSAMTVFAQMKDAILAGDTYRTQWEQLSALMQGNETASIVLKKLDADADKGAITSAKLQSSFDAATVRALSPKPNGWTDKMHALIRVRKVGEEQQGLDDEAIIARAEAKLAQGNVAQAIKELAQLSPQAADAMARWKKEAQHFLDTHEAVNALSLAIFTK